MGCPCCSHPDCDSDLESIRDRHCRDHADEGLICAITACSSVIEAGFRTCPDPNHRAVEAKYKERGTAMFQLKSRLERSKLSQTNDSLSLGSHDNPSERFNEESQAADDMAGLEGTGVSDEHVEVDTEGNISQCEGKSEKGNRTLRAQFGRRRSHNEELCVASCGVIHGRQRFFNSEAPNGVRVSILFLIYMYKHYLIQSVDVYDVLVSHPLITSWRDLA